MFIRKFELAAAASDAAASEDEKKTAISRAVTAISRAVFCKSMPFDGTQLSRWMKTRKSEKWDMLSVHQGVGQGAERPGAPRRDVP